MIYPYAQVDLVRVLLVNNAELKVMKGFAMREPDLCMTSFKTRRAQIAQHIFATMPKQLPICNVLTTYIKPWIGGVIRS